MDLKIYASYIEGKAQNQIYELAKTDVFKNSKIRIMPDVHAGKGCVVGFTANLENKVIPNVIGVDIGCLDKETEILTPKGWIKIADYKDEEILTYNKETDTGFFEKPLNYIVLPCKEFYHFNNSKELDQMVSEEHRMLVFKGYKKRGYNAEIFNPYELNSKSLEKGYYNFKTSFKINQKGLPLTENQIRILVMVQADAMLRDYGAIELHFKKERKIIRAEQLLNVEKIQYKKCINKDNSTTIIFKNDLFFTKDFSQFYNASYEQLKIFTDEVLKWDGHEGYRSFYSSTNKVNADVVQFAFTSTNTRASIYINEQSNKENWKTMYYVIPTRNQFVNYNTKGQKVYSQDGKKYCFTTSTGFFLARRNNKIFLTGNCGVKVVELGKIDIDCQKLDNYIKENIPFGLRVNSKIQKDFDLTQLYCYNDLKNVNKLNLSLGSLGGGE